MSYKDTVFPNLLFLHAVAFGHDQKSMPSTIESVAVDAL